MENRLSSIVSCENSLFRWHENKKETEKERRKGKPSRLANYEKKRNGKGRKRESTAYSPLHATLESKASHKEEHITRDMGYES
jgi:hypothetical protein